MSSQDAYRRGYDQIIWKPAPPREAKPRSESKRGDFPIPMMVRDFSEPVQSMADGRWHDSKSSLYRSYRADGNPQGVEYEVLGNDQRPEIQKSAAKSADEQKRSRRESIKKAEAMIASGNGVPLPE